MVEKHKLTWDEALVEFLKANKWFGNENEKWETDWNHETDSRELIFLFYFHAQSLHHEDLQ